MKSYDPFYSVSCKYGAPMGRRSDRHQWDNKTRLCARHQGGDGCYDKGGAYWGASNTEGPVWAVWEFGRGADCTVYVRAFNRDQAIKKALKG